MCGRYTIKTPAAELADYFHLPIPFALRPRYNVAPTQGSLAIRWAAGGREWVMLKWGLIPSWADDPKVGNRMINARSETVGEKPAFRSALAKRRCLIVADGFYEWKRQGEHKQPFHIRFRDGRPFALAGLWERWSRGVEPIESCTVLTTAPNELMRDIHDRMPVIVAPDDQGLWLAPEVGDAADLTRLFRPFPAAEMEARPVSARVNSPAVDDAACAEPASDER